jgi:hypothetical protein
MSLDTRMAELERAWGKTNLGDHESVQIFLMCFDALWPQIKALRDSLPEAPQPASAEQARRDAMDAARWHAICEITHNDLSLALQQAYKVPFDNAPLSETPQPASGPLPDTSDEERVRDLAQRMLSRWNGPSEMLLAFLRLLLPSETAAPESSKLADFRRQLAAERDHGKRLQQQLDAILRTDGSETQQGERAKDLQGAFDLVLMHLGEHSKKECVEALHVLRTAALRRDGGSVKVPEGWKLAREFPTAEQQIAGVKAAGGTLAEGFIVGIYRAMIAPC